MRAPIFRQIGKVAWKYYMLFQQHTSPEGEGDKEDPTWVIGAQPGPYIEHPSRSICTTFGKRIVFYGLDCRVDRTIDRICSATTYEKMFERLNSVVNTETKHVLLLLGVPIAYPRYEHKREHTERYSFKFGETDWFGLRPCSLHTP